jgi:hypothetical protein
VLRRTPEERHLLWLFICEHRKHPGEDPRTWKRGLSPLLGEERPRQQQGLEQRSRLAGEVSIKTSLLPVPVVKRNQSVLYYRKIMYRKVKFICKTENKKFGYYYYFY